MALIPNVKVTMEFAMGAVGWSESHIYNGTNVNDVGLYAAMKALAKARTQALGGNASFQLVKASQEQVNRDVTYLKRPDVPIPRAGADYLLGPEYPFATATTWTFQSPHLSWPIKLNDANQNQLAITYCAGMPGSTGQFGPGPYDVNAVASPGGFLDLYAKYLVAGGLWGVASRGWPLGIFDEPHSFSMTAPPAYVPAAGAVPAQIQFTLPAILNGVTIKPGVWIRVGGLKYNAPQNRLRLNGSYQIISYVTNTATVNVPRLRADPRFASNGYVQAAVYAFQPYQGYTLDNITHRKRGRVASSPAGRRSSR